LHSESESRLTVASPLLARDPLPAPAPPLAPERARQKMLDGPILPTLLRLAIPNIVVVVVQATSSAVDAFWLGRLGPEVLAGVALVFPTWMLMVTMSAGGMGGGISSSVARALGARRRADADDLVTHSLVLAVALAAIFSAAVLIGGPRLYGAMAGSGTSVPVLATAVAYSNVVFAGALAVWLVNALGSVLRGSGEMLVPAVIIVTGELLHLALAPALIFGLGPIPALGVIGAGTSLVTSYALRAAALGGYLLARRAGVSLPIGHLRLRRSTFWEILRVGLPGSLNTVLTNANVMAVTSLVGSSGVFALAGYGLAARLEYLQIPIVFGFGTALVTMVGTNVGAGQAQRARRVAWVGATVAALATGSVGLLAAFAPDAWLGLFTGDPAVLATGETYLRIVGPTFGFFGLGLALYFAAQGAGHLALPLAAGFGRLAVAVGGGWLAIYGFQSGLPWLFLAVALGFVGFGVVQALAVRWVIRARVSTG
jgi:putative MATE family efflux protein